MSKKDNFNSTERKILRLLYQTKVPLTTYEVAKELRISFPTARKYLEILVKKRVIK
jgi:response regulator of citrate/malate metabolism